MGKGSTWAAKPCSRAKINTDKAERSNRWDSQYLDMEQFFYLIISQEVILDWEMKCIHCSCLRREQSGSVVWDQQETAINHMIAK